MSELNSMIEELDKMYMRLLRMHDKVTSATYPVICQKIDAEMISNKALSAIANAHGEIDDLKTRLESCGVEL
jgi:hypothetical protein